MQRRDASDSTATGAGYDRAAVGSVAFSWRDGCRGHPDPPAGWSDLVAAAEALAESCFGGEVLDASGCLGVPGRAAPAERTVVFEPSATALAALRHDLAAAQRASAAVPRVSAGLPWDAPQRGCDRVLLAPPAERGTARVHAEIAAAARVLREDGVAWMVLEKDRGAKRYERDAGRWFGAVEVTARRKGFRLARLSDPTPDGGGAPWIDVDTPWGPAWALAGCYAAGKVDPGTAAMLRALEAHGAIEAGASVLDLGCGWGPLSRYAAERGAHTTAVDDDLAAVRSTERNVPRARVLHADLDDALAPAERFDRVLLNPPFHVGAGVRLGLARRFLEVALARVAPDGETWIVANEALPYEASLASAGRLDVVRRDGGFKVMRVRPGTSR